MKIKCKICHREYEVDSKTVQLNCRCGNAVYDKYEGEDKNVNN